VRAEIERLKSERDAANARIVAQANEWRLAYNSLCAERDALREALGPFAQAADKYDGVDPRVQQNAIVPIAALRGARAALGMSKVPDSEEIMRLDAETIAILTEEIARLREALEQIVALDGWTEDWGDSAKEFARAALAPRPPEGKGE